MCCHDLLIDLKLFRLSFCVVTMIKIVVQEPMFSYLICLFLDILILQIAIFHDSRMMVTLGFCF